jgi:hypothetical protein
MDGFRQWLQEQLRFLQIGEMTEQEAA